MKSTSRCSTETSSAEEPREDLTRPPPLDLKNKTALVMAGTSGTGHDHTRGSAQAGANVVPTGRRAEPVRNAAAEVVALGRRSFQQTCDVTANASVEELLQAVCADLGSVNILVSCVGRTRRMSTLEFHDWACVAT